MIYKLMRLPPNVDLSLMLRGVFASSVVWWHTLGYQLDFQIASVFHISGRLAVWMFFGISGYVIGYGFFSQRYPITAIGILSFLTRRIFRILPLFWFATFFTIVMFWLSGRPTDLGFSQLFALQLQHRDYPVGVFWTLGLELQFYLIAPVVTGILLYFRQWSFQVGIGLWVVLWLWFGDIPDDRSLLGNLQHFIAGMLVSKAYLSGYLDKYLSKRGAFVFSGIGFLSISIANLFYHSNEFWSLHGSFVSDVAIVSLLIVHCALERMRVVSNPVTRVLMVLGVLAYGLYAWHGVLLVIWPNFGVSFSVTFLISLSIALTSYFMIERPLINISGRIVRQVERK